MLDALHYQQGRGSYLHKVITFLFFLVAPLDGGGQRCCLTFFAAVPRAVLGGGTCSTAVWRLILCTECTHAQALFAGARAAARQRMPATWCVLAH